MDIVQANFGALDCEYTNDGPLGPNGWSRGDGTGTCVVITAVGETRLYVLYSDVTGDCEASSPSHAPADADCVFQVFSAEESVPFGHVECAGWCWLQAGAWTTCRVLDGMWAMSVETSFSDSVTVLAATSVPSTRLADTLTSPQGPQAEA